jgi:hypothetical protein
MLIDGAQTTYQQDAWHQMISYSIFSQFLV